MWTRLFACAAVAIVLAGCDKDSNAPEVADEPAVAAPAAPAASLSPTINLLSGFKSDKASVLQGKFAMVDGDTLFTLSKGGRVGVSVPVAIAAGDSYEATIVINASKLGNASILLGHACNGPAEKSSAVAKLVEGANELKVEHKFANAQTCARILVGTTSEGGVAFSIKSAVLQKK